MKIEMSEVYTSQYSPLKVRFHAIPDQHDVAYSKKIRELKRKGSLNLKTVEVDLVNGGRLMNIHPDLLGLVALLIVAPFSRKTVQLDFPVSDGFLKVVRKHLVRLEAPADETLRRRELNSDSRPGLAFSGGVDSCAALAVMPQNTVPVFLRRRIPENAAVGNYDESAALISCEKVRQYGFDVHEVSTSLEYIRRPVGNPVDWSNSAPAVLNADFLSLNSVSFGAIAESVYWTGGPYFSDLKDRALYANWAPIFDYCNIPMSFPTASLSEVLTSRICMESEYDFLPQSCVRGTPGLPCNNCFKCFRKALVDAALNGTAPPAELITNARASREIMGKLAEEPIHHEIVLAWAMKNPKLAGGELIESLKKKLGVVTSYGNNLDFIAKYYPNGLSYASPRIRTAVAGNIARFCTPMTQDEVTCFEAWNAEAFRTADSYVEGSAQLNRMLEGLS